jgi:predicted site-specific integrase-resolvase
MHFKNLDFKSKYHKKRSFKLISEMEKVRVCIFARVSTLKQDADRQF